MFRLSPIGLGSGLFLQSNRTSGSVGNFTLGYFRNDTSGFLSIGAAINKGVGLSAIRLIGGYSAPVSVPVSGVVVSGQLSLLGHPLSNQVEFMGHSLIVV